MKYQGGEFLLKLMLSHSTAGVCASVFIRSVAGTINPWVGTAAGIAMVALLFYGLTLAMFHLNHVDCMDEIAEIDKRMADATTTTLHTLRDVDPNEFEPRPATVERSGIEGWATTECAYCTDGSRLLTTTYEAAADE